MSSELTQRIREAGVVGAGGAGFPSHIKADAQAQTAIANGAECEPLMCKDIELMHRFAGDVVKGLRTLMEATGAAEGVVGIKAKHAEAVADMEEAAKGRPGLRVQTLGDYYPAGDEFSLVYEVTGKLIPPAGIPIQIGVVVNNVETLYNISRSDKTPVIEKFVTVAGAVKNPRTLRLPVGTSFAEAVRLAGGATVEDPAGIDGGAMMGRVIGDFSEPITKTTGGLIVLPKDHPLIFKKSRSRQEYTRYTKSTCDQCTFCTEFCPRYLLGYAIQPHKVIRSLGFSGSDRKVWDEWALLCCECSLCSLYACPEELDPKNICVAAKADLRETGVKGWKDAAMRTDAPPRPHPMLEYRRVPTKRLIRKLGLAPYVAEAPLLEDDYAPKSVRILLKQHLGAPAAPVVKTGQKVRKGEMIADVPAGQLGAKIHASISGTVRAVDTAVVIEA